MPSSTPSSTDTPAGGGAQSGLRTSTIIVIASLGSVAVISPIAGLGLLMWIRRRRQRYKDSERRATGMPQSRWYDNSTSSSNEALGVGTPHPFPMPQTIRRRSAR